MRRKAAAPEALGSALRLARAHAGMTQRQLAEAAGIAQNHVARLESGEKLAPRFDTVARIAVALGLSIDGLANRCGYRVPVLAQQNAALEATRMRNVLSQVRRSFEAAEREVVESMRRLEASSKGTAASRRR